MRAHPVRSLPLNNCCRSAATSTMLARSKNRRLRFMNNNLPLSDGPVLMEHSCHRLGPAERILRECLLVHLEAETGFVRKREAAIDHAHGREAEPLLPHLLLHLGLYSAADLLHEEVRCRSIDVHGREAADRA